MTFVIRKKHMGISLSRVTRLDTTKLTQAIIAIYFTIPQSKTSLLENHHYIFI